MTMFDLTIETIITNGALLMYLWLVYAAGLLHGYALTGIIRSWRNRRRDAKEARSCM